MNNTNPELPVEVENALYTEAEEIYNKLNELAQEQDPYDFGLPMCNKVKAPIEAALTAYAIKWFYSFEENGKLAATVADNLDTIKVLEYDNTRLKGEVEGYKVACEELKKENEKLKATTTGWRPLLEEVLKLDDFEIAHISDELFEKIKRFLYGE